jgi:hypothetical protein
VKNRRHALKIWIELGGDRPDDYVIKHWENMICLIAFKAKQNEATNNHARNHACIYHSSKSL